MDDVDLSDLAIDCGAAESSFSTIVDPAFHFRLRDLQKFVDRVRLPLRDEIGAALVRENNLLAEVERLRQSDYRWSERLAAARMGGPRV